MECRSCMEVFESCAFMCLAHGLRDRNHACITDSSGSNLSGSRRTGFKLDTDVNSSCLESSPVNVLWLGDSDFNETCGKLQVEFGAIICFVLKLYFFAIAFVNLMYGKNIVMDNSSNICSLW